MSFLPIKRDDLYSFIDYCYINRHYAVQIILNNGTIVVGHITHQKHESTFTPEISTNPDVNLIPSYKQCFYNGCLIITLHNYIEFEEEKTSIIFPQKLLKIELIAGISVIIFKQSLLQKKSQIINDRQKKIYPSINVSIDKSFLHHELDWSLPSSYVGDQSQKSHSNVKINFDKDDFYLEFVFKKHIRNCFRYAKYEADLHIPSDYDSNNNPDIDLITDGIQWGKAEPTNDTPLYADWEYLSRISHNINTIGVGIPFGSFSIGWENSLWKKLFENADTEKVFSLKDVTHQYFGTFQGNIEFLKAYNATTGNHFIQYVEMENTKWMPALIKEDSYVNKSDATWGIVYFRRDSLMLPPDTWPAFDKSITVFGDIVHVPLETKYGKASFFIKARVAVLFKKQLRE